MGADTRTSSLCSRPGADKTTGLTEITEDLASLLLSFRLDINLSVLVNDVDNCLVERDIGYYQKYKQYKRCH